MVSTPERALLELLDEVGVRQPLQQARKIAEGTYNLPAEVLMDLLKQCTSVKSVRRCNVVQYGVFSRHVDRE